MTKTEQKIIKGNCLEEMKKIEESSIDLILTDPPYNVSEGKDNIRRNGGKYGVQKDVELDFGEWDHNKITPDDFIDKFVSLLKENGVICIFYDKLYLGDIGRYLQDKYGFQVRHIGSYIKSNPVPQARKVKWQNGVENFLIATANKGTGHHFNYELGQSPDYFEHYVNYKHYHPTQKPLKLIKWIMKYWSFEGDMVLDPFLGSGTTLVACKELNRNGIGIELSDKYCDISRERLKKSKTDDDIKDKPKSVTLADFNDKNK